VRVLQLPHGSNDAIAWFRPELAATVDWAGDPRKSVETDSQTGRVSPRRSFATWRETVRGQSTPWTENDRAAAAEIRRIIGDCFVRRAEAELARLRNLDPLTGLPNRRLLQERLDAVAATAGTDRPAAAALIYIDLDRFKDVNDSLGHDAGDALLLEIALRLHARIEQRHLVARIGGDEFAILCEDVDITQAEAVADSVRQALDLPFALAGRPYRATASVGVAHTLANDLDGATLLQAADAAMYVAKRGGGNGAARYAEPLRAEITRRFLIEQDLRTALQSADGGGLMLHYQPVIEGSTGRLEGFEALARWRLPDGSPEGRQVPPVDFIPVAEAGGLIGELGDWVLDAALDEAVRWAAYLTAGERAPYVAVNVSPRQLSSGAFQARVTAALAGRGLAAQVLRVEVTEAAIADLAAGRELACLRAHGVRVAIDDFGTGYSSLSYLRRLPADVVKLDRSFLPGAKASPDQTDDAGADEAFMEAVVGVAHRAGLAVVAEGVETASQLAASVRAGIDSIQGYFFAPPMPAAAVHALLSQPQGAARTEWIKAARRAQAEARQMTGVSRRLQRRPTG
jgi:diguanylate cyclase (GGDEF)-like protein